MIDYVVIVHWRNQAPTEYRFTHLEDAFTAILMVKDSVKYVNLKRERREPPEWLVNITKV